VDIFDHVTSLARASHSSVEELAGWGHFISVSRRLPACGGSACISTLRRRHYFDINSA